jgi:Kdo2-lipid IVA lauroyltransferase/acyltransferase
MRPRAVRHWLEFVAFQVVVCLVRMLTWRSTIRVCRRLAWVFAYLLPRKLSRYHVARENLERAFGPLPRPEVDRLIRGMWMHLFRMVVEIVQLDRKLRLQNSADVLAFRHRDEVVRTLCCGRPVIMLSGHFGNWEIANRAMGLFGFPMGVVARNLDNPHLHRWFARFRESDGHRLIDKSGGGNDVVDVLRDGGTVAMLCDQDAGRKGQFADFFGQPASHFKSIALLALRFRAVIVVTGTRRLPDDLLNERWTRFEIGCEEIIDPDRYVDDPDAIRAITERYAAALERAIRRAPEQYLWVHRRWKSEPRHRAERTRRAA